MEDDDLGEILKKGEENQCDTDEEYDMKSFFYYKNLIIPNIH